MPAELQSSTVDSSCSFNLNEKIVLETTKYTTTAVATVMTVKSLTSSSFGVDFWMNMNFIQIAKLMALIGSPSRRLEKANDYLNS